MNPKNSRENRIHTSQGKPFSYYQCMIPDQFTCAPMHWHNEFEINFVREGHAEFTCGEEKMISSAGDIIVIQPNVMHSVYACPNTHQVYDTLVFSHEIFGSTESGRYISECIRPLVNGSMQVQTYLTPKHPYYIELEMMMENIFACVKGDTPRLDMLMRSELTRFFWLLETEAEIDTDFREPGEIIRPALEYIAEHFQEAITIRQLATVVHLSESYFMNQFQKHVGFSAVEYISHFRINRACRLLTNTKQNVLDIAFDCGFRNISNFNRQFRKITGCSPTEYRKKSQNFQTK
ncbi:AraC family transcriptional regulator [uncultured Ruminococcus sp.]|uniref:helix-turn-helix domain-containing protein n=1 Tax=uncultured Ruminococcus sp. TaxID=165186 RepID=UPI00267705A3|nr:AraC family transcriptional regulator [uncultured Ruminococcus sp.]